MTEDQDDLDRRHRDAVDVIHSPEEMEKIYDDLLKVGGMRLMAHLVEANVVLSIAGARPQTEFYIFDPTPEDHANIELLQQHCEPKNIEFQDAGEFNAASDGRRTCMISVTSLPALEQVSRSIRIKNFPEYSVKTGPEGARRWAQRAHSAIEKAQARGELERGMHAGDFLVGIEKGYPLTAIVDACIGYERDKLGSSLLSTRIPGADLYGGAYPEFDYAPEHEGHPDIVRTERAWQKALDDFYSTHWHRALAENPEFQNERAKMRS